MTEIMTSGITGRIFNGHMVRFFIRPDGLWSVLSDLAEPLGYANIRKSALEIIQEEDRNTVTISDGNRGNPNLTIISEAGLYELIFSSRKPEAIKFKNWVFKEVLPAIRKEGFYVANGVDPQLARVAEGRLLLERARLLRLQAAELVQQAAILLTLEGGKNVTELLAEHAQTSGVEYDQEDIRRAALAAAAYARRNNIPMGRDRDGRMTLPKEDLIRALELHQSTLDLDGTET